MHFSTGQIAFIIFFIVVFIAALSWSYLRDKRSNTRHYRGSWKVLIIVILVMAALSALLRLSGSV